MRDANNNIPKSSLVQNDEKGATLSGRRAAFVRGAVALVAALSMLVSAGCCCKGYRFGTQGLYNDQIQTVYVQMVEADTYRRAFAERLTEAICKKITEQTPYQIATVEDADTLLAVKLNSESQSIAAYDRYDGTREKIVKLTASAVWRDLGSARVIAQTENIPVSMANSISVDSGSYLVAEVGQSSATAQQEAIDKLAAQIVGLMESEW